jgi:acyl-CoA synthetase (AMP-forming)/AMP-acid ligase II
LVHDVAVISLPDERLGEIVAAVIKPKLNVPESAETELQLSEFFEQNLQEVSCNPCKRG